MSCALRGIEGDRNGILMADSPVLRGRDRGLIFGRIDESWMLGADPGDVNKRKVHASLGYRTVHDRIGPTMTGTTSLTSTVKR